MSIVRLVPLPWSQSSGQQLSRKAWERVIYMYMYIMYILIHINEYSSTLKYFMSFDIAIHS